MTMEEALKIIRELQNQGQLNAGVHVRLTQDQINEFSPDQLDVLLEKNIISAEDYLRAKAYREECEETFSTRMQFVLSTGKAIAFPFEALRIPDKVEDMLVMVQANLISVDDYLREDERRKKTLAFFNDLIAPKPQPQRDDAISFTNFVVLSNVFKCNKNHHIEQIQATVNILTPSGTVEPHQVSAGYCKECGIYFILETDYNSLTQIGVLLCRKLTREVYESNGDSIISGDEFNTESLLHQIGYNVSSSENLTAGQRQHLLGLAIDNNLYSISGLLSFLDWLIARNKKVSNRDMSQAIEKWTEDRAFVASYQIGSQRKVGMDSVTVKDEELIF